MAITINSNATASLSLEEYLHLNYAITFYPDPDGGYVAEIKDLPGCLTQGETLEETARNIDEARALWIETAYEQGDRIPLPSPDEQNKLNLQIPKSLQQQLITAAQTEGVNLEQYILLILNSATKSSAHP